MKGEGATLSATDSDTDGCPAMKDPRELLLTFCMLSVIWPPWKPEELPDT